MIRVTPNDFSVDEVLFSLRTEKTGASVAFIGSVRGESDGEAVDFIEVTAYEEMATKQLESISDDAKSRYGVEWISIVHRVGRLQVSDNILLIVVGAKHRKEAFEACEYVLEEIKRSVPIWKKENIGKSSHWIEGEQHVRKEKKDA